jgi:hypothetical protein
MLTYLQDPAVQAALAGVLAWAAQKWLPFLPGNDGSETWRKKATAVCLALVGAAAVSWASGDWTGFVTAALLALGGSQTAFALTAATAQPRDPATGRFVRASSAK